MLPDRVTTPDFGGCNLPLHGIFKHRAAALACTAALTMLVLTPAQADDPLDQRWSLEDRTRWYESSQGSRLLPLNWYLALEQPDSEILFNDRAHIKGFRYIPRTTSAGLELPLGFSVDDRDDSKFGKTRLRWKAGQTSREPWLGMNCSACHTAEISYKGAALRIEGGPTLADFQGFMEALTQALSETAKDDAKFARFAERVVGASESDRTALKEALATQLSWHEAVSEINHTDLRYGFARLDAIGHIFNKVSLIINPERPLGNPANAPVSYPFLWNVPQHDRVQWNGIARNLPIDPFSFSDPYDPGALARNIGEVIGVFADVQPVAGAPLSGYPSSIDIANLVGLEQMLDRLLPPLWPAEVFGEPDPALVEKGASLYAEHCASCHKPLARTDLETPIKAQMSLFDGSKGPPPGTDPWMACNAYTYATATGILEGTPQTYLVGQRLGAFSPVATALTVTVLGTMANQKTEIARSALQASFGVSPPPTIYRPDVIMRPSARPGPKLMERPDPRAQRLARCMTEKSDILGYKARPLTGIWATAPYLHNGSVPTLYDLLLPPHERPTSFWLGSREYDPEKVGYVTEQGAENSFEFNTRDAQGNPIPGNANTGHDYANGSLTSEERRSLVEYMKTL
jgi:mono/diheme cytochrome c family protein